MNWPVVAVVALLLAIVLATGRGAPRERPSGLPGVVLRWGHAVVWFLLASTFSAMAQGLENVAAVLGLLALGGYVAFLGVLLRARRDPTHAATWQHIVVREPRHVAGEPELLELGIFVESAVLSYRATGRPEPWGRVRPGQRLWVMLVQVIRKSAGGNTLEYAIVAEVTVDRIRQVEECTRTELRDLTVGYRLHDLDAYWDDLVQGDDGVLGHMSAVIVWTRDERTLGVPFRPVLSPRDQRALLGASWIVVDTPELAATWLPPGSWAARQAPGQVPA